MSEARISARRVISGFVAGALSTIGIFVWLLWPAWAPVVVIGGGLAALLIPLVAVPIFIKLRKRGMLSVYGAALLGGVLNLIPALILAFFNLFNSPEVYQSQPDTGLVFLLQYFFLPGVIGGIIGWFVAAGFRLRAS